MEMEVRAAREEVPGGGVCFQWKARWLRIQGGARVHTQPACRTRLPSPDLCARARMRRESGGGPCAPESQVQAAVHADLKAPRVFSSPPISLQSPLPAPPARGSAARSARRRRRRRRRTGGEREGDGRRTPRRPRPRARGGGAPGATSRAMARMARARGRRASPSRQAAARGRDRAPRTTVAGARGLGRPRLLARRHAGDATSLRPPAAGGGSARGRRARVRPTPAPTTTSLSPCASWRSAWTSRPVGRGDERVVA